MTVARVIVVNAHLQTRGFGNFVFPCSYNCVCVSYFSNLLLQEWILTTQKFYYECHKIVKIFPLSTQAYHTHIKNQSYYFDCVIGWKTREITKNTPIQKIIVIVVALISPFYAFGINDTLSRTLIYVMREMQKKWNRIR